jgi:hypothetical protein
LEIETDDLLIKNTAELSHGLGPEGDNLLAVSKTGRLLKTLAPSQPMSQANIAQWQFALPNVAPVPALRAIQA